jgi:hypothetical protein
LECAWATCAHPGHQHGSGIHHANAERMDKNHPGCDLPVSGHRQNRIDQKILYAAIAVHRLPDACLVVTRKWTLSSCSNGMSQAIVCVQAPSGDVDEIVHASAIQHLWSEIAVTRQAIRRFAAEAHRRRYRSDALLGGRFIGEALAYTHPSMSCRWLGAFSGPNVVPRCAAFRAITAARFRSQHRRPPQERHRGGSCRW